MGSRSRNGDSYSSWVHYSTLLQHSDRQPTASGYFPGAADNQVYRRLQVKPLLSNPALEFYEGNQRFSRVFENTTFEVFLAGTFAIRDLVP